MKKTLAGGLCLLCADKLSHGFWPSLLKGGMRMRDLKETC